MSCALGTARAPKAKQLHHLHTQLSLGQSCYRQKNVLHLCVQGCFSRIRLALCTPVDCSLPDFSVRERGSPGKNTGAYWPILLTITFKSTIISCCPSCQLP